MSETGPILTLAHLRPHMDNWDAARRLPYLCRAGRPLPFVQLRIVDENMKDVPVDTATPGEIVVRAPWLTQGYLHDEARSGELWRGGWLHTGDVGFIDAEGYLKITDRIKDVVKTGGEWVSSLDIEDIILRMPEVAEAAVIGLPDERWGERPVALVVLRSGATCENAAQKVRDHVAKFVAEGAISRYAVPDHVHFVEAIPKTSVGKLDKKVIRERLLAGKEAA
jgi:fatty-acyl-CoA synthase